MEKWRLVERVRLCVDRAEDVASDRECVSERVCDACENKVWVQIFECRGNQGAK